MTFRGRVVLQFNIHKDGTITDVTDRRALRRSSRSTAPPINAILGSNPTEPLPPEYPDDEGVLHGHVLLQRTTAVQLTTNGRCRRVRSSSGLILVLAALVVYVFVRVL